MRLSIALMAMALLPGLVADAQTKKTTPRKPAPAPAPAPPVRIQAILQCPAELGVGVKTQRRFCDVMTGREPKEGILVGIPLHSGPVTLSFELHNRHTFSEELIRAKAAYRKYTATIGVLTLDNTLVERAVIQTEFRSASDLFDRISGGAGAGGVKAVAPSGDEFITMELPAEVGEQVSVLGEKLVVLRADGGTEMFTAPGRPVATISNVMIEYRPAPVRKSPQKKP